MSAQRHLVAVWNPSYAADVMDAHLSLLLRAVAEHRAGRAPEEDICVWWGKVRSGSRRQPLPHLDEILALDDEAKDESRELHLYLTDYRSLYVAHVYEITAEDVRAAADERRHVPDYYLRADQQFDCWFRLGDIRRVVLDDTLGVIDELRKLRNTRYHDRPVSLYGGMVDLPLIVTRDDGETYFDPEVRDRLTDGKYWVEFDAERTGLGGLERELRENLFGETAWRGLEPAVRGFIANAEHLVRTHRRSPGFDFSTIVIEFAKACEVQGNATLRRGLRRAKPEERMARVDGRTVDLTEAKPLTLVELARVLTGEPKLRAALGRTLRNGSWLTGSFPPILEELARHRNPGAHRLAIGMEEALDIRNRMVGVGCQGALVSLAGVQPIV